jgi:tetratricopeptide (TPR) repeat protein
VSEHIQEQPAPKEPLDRFHAVDVALPAPDIRRRHGKPLRPGAPLYWLLLVLAFLPPVLMEWYALIAVVVAGAFMVGVGVAFCRGGVFTWRRWSALPLKLYTQGKRTEAEACFQAALARADIQFGRDDFRRGCVLTQLADYAANAADFARAEPLYQEALRILCGAMEEDAADYFFCLNNYATMLINWKRHAKGAALLELAVQVVEPYARDAPEFLLAITPHFIRFNLIHVLIEEGRLAEAERLIDEWAGASRLRYFLGWRGVWTVSDVIAAAKARLACARGRYQEALEWCVQAAKVPDLNRLARCRALLGLGRHDEAAAAALESLIDFNALARTHPIFIDFLVVLVSCCLAKGDLTGALSWRDEARAIAAEHGFLEQPVWTDANQHWRDAAQSLGPEAGAAWEKDLPP